MPAELDCAWGTRQEPRCSNGSERSERAMPWIPVGSTLSVSARQLAEALGVLFEMSSGFPVHQERGCKTGP